MNLSTSSKNLTDMTVKKKQLKDVSGRNEEKDLNNRCKDGKHKKITEKASQ